MCKKEKPIKLGQIKNEKLEKFSTSITWNFDRTLCIFIRDALTEFKRVNDGIPQEFVDKYQDVDTAFKEYNNIIQGIIDNLNFYISEDYNLFNEKEAKRREAFNALNDWLPSFWW